MVSLRKIGHSDDHEAVKTLIVAKNRLLTGIKIWSTINWDDFKEKTKDVREKVGDLNE